MRLQQSVYSPEFCSRVADCLLVSTGDGSSSAASEVPPGLKALAGMGLDMVRTRASLIALEVEVEQARLVKTLVYAAAGLITAFMASTVLMVFVIASLWSSPYRLPLIFALAIGLVLAGLTFGWQARQTLLASPRPFEATLDALAGDLVAMK